MGNKPPNTKTPRHPNSGINSDAITPPKASPAVKPQNISVTIIARFCAGLNSAERVIAFGIAPPSPNPVAKRSQSRDRADGA